MKIFERIPQLLKILSKNNDCFDFDISKCCEKNLKYRESQKPCLLKELK